VNLTKIKIMDKKLVKKEQRTSVTDGILSDLVDALSTDHFNDILDKYTNTELDFETVVLFIKLYMLARKVTEDKDEIKSILYYAIYDSHTRSEIVKSFNDGTMVSTFLVKLKDKKLIKRDT
jgi:hypothetical protein